MRYLFILFLIPIIGNTQFFESNSQIVYGINLGTHIGNDSTALLYNGYYNPTYNINTILFSSNANTSNNNLTNYLDETLGYDNWQVQNVPAQMNYRPGLEVGIHVGIQKEKIKYYLDYNFAELKAVGEFNIVQVFNSANNVVKENVLVSVVGEERRSFINLGLISELKNENEYHLGLPFFFQINQTKFKNNYMLVDNQKYSIPNPSLTSTTQNNINQIGSGFGLGTGLVGTIALNESINFSIAYHLQYSNIKITNDFNHVGLQNSIIARIIWNKE